MPLARPSWKPRPTKSLTSWGLDGSMMGKRRCSARIAGVGGDLGGVAPGVVADDDEAAGVVVGAGQDAQGQGVGGDVQADGLETGDRAAADHLGAVDHGDGEGLVVGEVGHDAFFVEQGGEGFEGVEEAGDGGAGVAGEQVDAAFDFQGALNEQLVAGEDFRAGVDQETWIDSGQAGLTRKKPPAGLSLGLAIRGSWKAVFLGCQSEEQG